MIATEQRPYVALYAGKKIEVYATSSFEAQKKAARLMKARASYQVSVYLADVVHSTGSL